jgi:hypothetical protein
MSAISTIEKVLATLAAGPLEPAMVEVPKRGATDAELRAERPKLGRDLSAAHRQLLEKWNGLNLDMLRVLGVGAVEGSIRPLGRRQSLIQKEHADWIVFADNPAGFVYAEDSAGRIHSIDTQSWKSAAESIKPIASDLDDFFERYVFGRDSDQFCADDWKEKLHAAGVW